jgi:hypothetical protein
MTNFRLHHRAARHYRAGRVFLAGDAAHIHSPAGAQGMNTGIQDAVNLGWKLAHSVRGVVAASVLDTYETERAPIGRTVLRFTDRAFKVSTSMNPVVRLARTKVAPLVLPVVLGPRRLRGYAFRTVAQLGIRYRGSPLSRDGPGRSRGGPAAGDRLPDLAVVRDGRPSSLHEVVAPAGWHLLAYGTELAQASERLLAPYRGLVTVHRIVTGAAPDGVVLDQAALRHLGWHGRAGVLLVRPDGHVGYRAGKAGVGGLGRYLPRWLIPS